MAKDLFEEKAVAVANELSKDKRFSAAPGDHPFLDMLMQLLQQLMPLLIGCFATPKAAHAELQRPSLFTRMRLRSLVRKNHVADQDESVGAISAAVLKVAKDTTESEISQMAS